MDKIWARIALFCLIQPPLIINAAPPVLNATASTLNGVAPLGVFFDATNTTSDITSEPFAEIEYEWNFGDAGSGNWNLTNLPKNRAHGAMGFHVFDNPGIYQVQLTARDAQGGSAAQNFTITVNDPDVVFSGANTVCFSPTDFVGCPVGAQQVTTNQWGTLQSHMASGKRLLLRRGATFTAASGLTMSADGPGDISAFGSGARPLVQAQGTTIPITQPWLDASLDWRVRGLEFRGSYPSNPTPGNGIEFGNRWLVQNNVITSFQYGAIAAGFTRNDIYFVENDIVDNKHLGTYISGISPRVAIFGNRFHCPTTTVSTSLLRTYVKNVVISHNQFDEIGGAGSHQIKFCGGSVADPSRYSIVSSNIFNDPALPNSWMVSVGPENNSPTSTQPVDDFIFERNIVRAPTTNSLGLQSRGASRVTVRNNIFHNTTGINMSIPVPGFSAWDHWHILNNVFYNTTTGGYVLNTDQPLTNLKVQNNVVSFPNVTSASNANLITLSATPRSQITDSHNTWHVPQVALSGNVFRSQEGSYSRQNWTSQTCANGVSCGQSTLTDDPQFQNPSAGDFHLQSGSPSLDSGVSLAAVLSDFAGNLRTGVADRGIFNGGAGGGGGPSGPQCNDGIDNDGDGLIDWQYDLGCYDQNDTTEGGISAALDNGWTVFEKSIDTRVVYVSQSQGSDTYTGLCPDAPSTGNCGPKQTLAAGMALIRDTYPDWLLLRRGDVWIGQGLTNWNKSGRSASAPLVIGSYGSSQARPRIETDNGFTTDHLRDNDFISLLDLHFVRSTQNAPETQGVYLLGGGDNILIENVKSERFNINVGLQAYAGRAHANVAIRRSVFVDAYSASPTVLSQGGYISGVIGLLMEDLVFDHNGWSETIPGARAPNSMMKNLYLQYTNRGVVFRRNISARSASDGFVSRSGGEIDNNLLLKNYGNAFGCDTGDPENCGDSSTPRSGTITNNVVLESRDILSGVHDGGNAFRFEVSQAVMSGNVIAHGGTDPSIRNVRAIEVNDAQDLRIENNVIFNWYRPGSPGLAFSIAGDFLTRIQGNRLHMSNQSPLYDVNVAGNPAQLAFSNNQYYSLNSTPFSGATYANWLTRTGETGSSFGPINFPDSSRSIQTYMQSLGMTPTLEAFLAEARQQSKWYWRSAYTADVANNYIRAGFGMGSPGGPSINTCTSITQWGITWTFNQTVECGQFANGDWWVVGPVTIDSISPPFSNGRNGWEVNPNSTVQQGFDNRIDSYDAARIPSLPYSAQPNSSVVKAISAATCPENGVQSCLQTAAVLTVVGAPPPNNGSTVFRPPYFGPNKPYTSITELQPQLLPSLAPVANTPTLAVIENRYSHVQLDHKTGWTGRAMHPRDNMSEYYADISQDSNEAALRLMLNDPISAKAMAAIYYVQAGIDLFSVYSVGNANWTAGDHGLGRKLTITFAAVMLNNPQMKSAIQSATENRFEEDGGFAYSPIANNGNGQLLWGQPDTYNQYWSALMTDLGGRSQVDRHGYIDGGSRPGGTYQYCCFNKPLKGSALPLVLMPSLAAVWNNNRNLTYADRMVSFGAWTQPDPCAPLEGVCASGPHVGQSCTSAQENDPLNFGFNSYCAATCNYQTPSTNPNYGVTFGPNPSNPSQCIPDTDSSDGIGRFPLLHGASKDVGYYDSGFVNAMWAAYRGLTIPNHPPTVSAGPDQTIMLPQNQVSLGGSVTDDNLPNPPGQVTALWSHINGAGTVAFANPVSPNTVATFSQSGTYVLRLTGNDSALSVSDDVQITVNSGGQNSSVTETKLVPCSNPKDRRERSRIPICFDLKEPGNVTLTLYSRHGLKIRELIKGYQDAGENEIFWDLNDDSGNAVASGTYIINFESSGVNQTSKVAVVR